MLRFYFSQVTTDAQDGFCAVARQVLIATGGAWRCDAADLRTSSGVSGATHWMLVLCDVDATQHAALIANAGIVYLPIETPAGDPLGMDDLVSAVDATRRSQITTRLEARHIPMDGIALSDPIRRVIGRIVRRGIIRRILNGDDYTEGLNTLVSAMNTAKRNRIATALQARGFVTSGILGTDTIREALRKLAVQDVPILRNGWD